VKKTGKYTPKDEFYQRAKQDNFVARSIYKLEEIDERHHVLAKGGRVVDLGCSPGSWLQYAGEVVGAHGLVLGYDLVPPRAPAMSQVRVFEADVHAVTVERIRADLAAAVGAERVGDGLFDTFLSDMAPKTTGIRDADQARSEALVECALGLAEVLLRPGGAFVAKTFQGRGIDALLATVKKGWSDTRVLKPKATREGSRELFIVCRARAAREA
jgi:23S rRNA (uridine2552-2'-O)-methyltransferase